MSLKYRAFISYRHADNKEQGRQWATWLHQAIETYEVPADLVGKKNGRGEEIPARIYPIFRDEEELPAYADLGGAITRALNETRLLLVLCSPRAVESTYVADEIDYFKKLGHSNKIIAAMIDGEPNASWDKGKQEHGFRIEDECFPIPLQFEYDQDGNRTIKHAEPIAADFRINNDGVPEQGWTSIEAYRLHLNNNFSLDKNTIQEKIELYQKQQDLMLLKIIAGVLGVPLGELTLRDKEYQLVLEKEKAKKLKLWLSLVMVLAVVASAAGGFAFLKKEQATKEKNSALITQSRYLLDLAGQESDKGNYDTALLLGLNAMPGRYGGDRPEVEDESELLRAVENITLKADFGKSEKHVISKNGEVLVMAKGKTITIWSVPQKKVLNSFELPYEIGELYLSSSSNILVVGSAEQDQLTVWSVPNQEIVKTFQAEA